MSVQRRDSEIDGSFIIVPLFCTILAWAPIGIFMAGESLPVGRIVSIACHMLVWWSGVFFFGLIIRDTIRQRGKWTIELKLPVCPQCGLPLRTMRFLIWLQRTFGCWKCHECGFEMTKWGRPVKEQYSLARWAVLRALGAASKHEDRPQGRDERIQSVKDQTQ